MTLPLHRMQRCRALVCAPTMMHAVTRLASPINRSGSDVRRRPRWATMRSRPLAVSLLAGFIISYFPAALPAAFGQTAANNPPLAPHSILVFPQRDFVSASGFGEGDLVTVEVFHPGSTSPASSAIDVVPLDDPGTTGFDGLVEVNHPGGACWVGVTPDIRPGDRVRTTVKNVTGTIVSRDETTVSNVTAQRPVQTAADTVVVRGTAQDATGAAIDITQLEQRLVVPRDAFDKNGRRTLRAPGDGAIAYDAQGSINWTATYTGLTLNDVSRALGAESRIMWLGTNPAAAVEATVFEIGAGIGAGPAAPCTAPLEKLPPPPGSELVPPSTPTGLKANVSNSNTVSLSWTASTDNIGVTSYGVYRNGTPIANVQNADGSAPASTTYVDKNVPPGSYTYTVDAADAVGNRSEPSAAAGPVTTTRQVATLPAGVTAHEPPAAPLEVIPFPSRDFVSISGYHATDQVDIQIVRDGVLVSSASGQIPQDDPTTPDFEGIVEINHPGGGCWEGVTPELRAGDIVRSIAYNADRSIRSVDQTTVAAVTDFTAESPAAGTVLVHGTAMSKDGKPLPIDQLEQRLINGKDRFDINGGKRRIQAPGEGTLFYDTTDNPLGIKWTATYTGLSQADVNRALAAESRILWLGTAPLTTTQITIFENPTDPAGPALPDCTASLEPADTAPPSVPTVSASHSGADINVTWRASTDDWYVLGYRITRDTGTPAALPLALVGGTDLSFVDKNVPPGAHTYTVAAFDSASPRGAGATIADEISTGLGNPYGNFSAESAPASTDQADVTAPSVPTNVVARVTGQDVTLTWSASTDNTAVAGYGVYRHPFSTTTPAAWEKQGGEVSGTSFTQLGVAAGTYEYTVDAVDAANNRSAKADPPATATVGAADTIKPSDVTGLSATNSPDIHGKDVKVTWNTATDNVAVTGYGVYRDGTKIADVNVPALSFTDLNRPAGTYKYTVDAVDSAGNRSANKPAEVSVVIANDPPLNPHGMTGFPSRDFISATGTPGTAYTFSVLRGARTIATSTPVVADAAGLVEVNHPGGGCWNTVTPNIQPGDVIRMTDPNGVAHQTTVARVTAERPMAISVKANNSGGTVEVHGTADDGTGKQVSIDQLEQRLIHKDLFSNGRNKLLAPGDGTLSYDSATSTRWTATYNFTTETDLLRAVGGTSSTGALVQGAESRILWLGRAPLVGNEQTIFENGPGVLGGPGGVTGCTEGPAETPAPTVTLTTAPRFFADTAIGATSANQVVTLSNSGGLPLHISRAYIAGLHPGDFVVTPSLTGATVAAGASVTVNVTFKPTAVGMRQANLSFADDAANTMEQTILLSGTGTGGTVVTAPAAPTGLTATAGNAQVALSWNASAGATSYTAKRRISGQTTTHAVVTGGTGLTGTTFIDATVSNGTTYEYVVTASNTAGESGNSNQVTATPTAPAAATPTVSFNPTSVNFGNTRVSRSSTKTVTVKNTGAVALTIGAIAIDPATGSAFKVSASTCGTTLAAGRSCKIDVIFTPTSAGATNAVLVIPNNAPGNTQRVSLTGRGS
jgi:hypothetical protein